ncbi:unnamed protein product [Orchesella dallaii]|uniref:Pleckstrin y domain-containing family G member 7 n=1 Tax=Orchesella dallaii TaxID=48710 RepID=A0ABP1PNB6_9HEXA
MNRHYSLFSSRAKARREKFASTRKSLSESWEQTFTDESAGYTVLPSPTIGDESGIPERLALALSPLAREHQAHIRNFSTMSSSSSSGIGTGGSGSLISTTKTSAASSSIQSQRSQSTGRGSGEAKFPLGVGDRPQRKLSPRLQIVRQLSQPVLRTAEIIELKHGRESSSGSPALASSSRYLTKQSTAPSYDWGKDVSTQCNISQLSQPSGGALEERSRDHGPPMTKSSRLENFRRCKSFDWDHFREFTQNVAWENDHKSSKSCSTTANHSATCSTSSGTREPIVSREERSTKLVNKSSKSCLIKNTESTEALLSHIQSGTIISSASSSPSSSHIYQDFSSSPPVSPRKFGLRAMPNIFSFNKDKMSSSGSAKDTGVSGGASKSMRKLDPPTHLDLFGTPSSSQKVTTVFETTVCKKCALLLPQSASEQCEKPDLMQQHTQTDFPFASDISPNISPSMSIFNTGSTLELSRGALPPTAVCMSTSRTTKCTNAKPSTCSAPVSASTASKNAMYICQKHQERLMQTQQMQQQQQQQQRQSHSVAEHMIPPEKKYVPSPLAVEKCKSTSTPPVSSGLDHGPDSPGPAISGGAQQSQSLQQHQHQYHQHNKHSLAYSLPIPQVALQYANIPQGDPTPCHSGYANTQHQHHHHHQHPQRSANYDSAPNSRSCSTAADTLAAEGRGKSSTLPTIDSKHIVAIRSAEKRRRFFAKKQTNSAPDTFDSHTFLTATQGVLHTTRRLCGNCKEPVTNCLDGVLRATRREKGDTSALTPPSVEVWESEIRTARCGNVAVTHVSELDYPDADPPCHFCCEQASTAIHDASRLQIVSGGLVRSRDGSARSGSAPYINLPSPNVQAENGQQAVFPSLELSPSMSQTLSPGSHYDHPANVERQSPPTRGGSRGGSLAGAPCGSVCSSKADEEDPLVGPPASSLTRRPALVPPKIIPDPDYENDADRDKNSCRSSDDNTSPRARRSSIVVIPPMQICPGDLLVYGKCLSQRKSLLGTTIESPSPIHNMLDSENTSSRKGKATWSLLKLFERGSRPKGGPSGAIEEIMSLIQPCDYSDPKLTRFKGMCWSDFVSHVANQKIKKTGSCGSVTSGSSSEGSQSNQGTGATLKGPIGGDPKSDNQLVQANTTDSATSSGVPGAHQALTSTPSAPPTITTSITTTAATGGKDEKASASGSTRSPKPLVRKRIGLMRTMSDRCLERRITPALFRGTQGFLMGEKLVEGKETEPTGKPFPLNPVKSEKDLLTNVGNKENTTSGGGTSVPSAGPQQPPPEESISDPDVRQKMRQKEALWDLFQSECSFLYDHLMVLKNVFLEPLKRIQVEGIAMYAEPELLFGNLDELCGVTYAFCKEFIHLLLKLTDAAGDLSTTEVLAKLFEPSSKARAMSQAYHRYALNYINALNYLETLRRQVEFNEFEKLCMKDPRCKKLQLTDLLVSPVQHIMKVPLILKDIQSRTNEPQEKELISQILEIQENSIRELDDKMKWLKNYERLLEIQRNIVWPSILEMEPKTWVPEFLRVALSRQPCDSIIVSPRRQIIHEGLLQLWDTGKPTETYVILFDDMLLITRRKKGLSKKKSSLTENWQSACGKSGSVVGSGLETNHRYIVYRQPISLDRFFIHDIAEAENTSAKLDYAFVLVALNRFQQIVAVHTFQAPSEQVKNLWLLKLKSTQEKWKRTLQTTVFRGVRSSTDSGQSNVASSLVFGLNKQFMRHNEA